MRNVLMRRTVKISFKSYCLPKCNFMQVWPNHTSLRDATDDDFLLVEKFCTFVNHDANKILQAYIIINARTIVSTLIIITFKSLKIYKAVNFQTFKCYGENNCSSTKNYTFTDLAM